MGCHSLPCRRFATSATRLCGMIRDAREVVPYIVVVRICPWVWLCGEKRVKYSAHAECEIIHFVNCEIFCFAKCEIKFASSRAKRISHAKHISRSEGVFHSPQANFTAKEVNPNGFTSFAGAGGGTRTHTMSPSTDFESVTSANSITPAYFVRNGYIVSYLPQKVKPQIGFF